MGIGPSKPSEEELATLDAQLDANCRAAADALRRADVFLLCTGAGFSADSGLAVYQDIAEIEAYEDMGLRYHDICRPEWLKHDPEIFYGFWGACYNDYRDTGPHQGYGTLQQWRDTRFASSKVARAIRSALKEAEEGPDMASSASGDPAGFSTGGSSGSRSWPYAITGHAGAFFLYTSNVDAHSFDFFDPFEVRECHGNTEVWQCGGDKPCCKRTWRAPLNFRFAVDTRTMRAPRSARGIAEPDPTAAASEKVGSVDKAKAAGQDEGTEKARVGRVHKPFGRRNAPLSRLPREESEEVAVAFPSGSNWPSCPFCKGPARPAVLMFNDLQWINDAAQERRWQAWKEAVTEVARSLPVYRRNMLRIVILEIGCGGNVPTVRHASEGAATQFKDCADVTVIRINPDYPLPDRLHQPTAHLRHLALPVRGLEALECISKHYQELVGPRTVAPEPLSSPPSGLVLEASRSRSRSRSQGGKSSSDEKQNGRNNGKAEEAARKSRGLTPSPRLGPQRMPRAAALACLEKKPWRGGSREDTAPAESRPKPTRRQPTSSAQPISID